MAATAKSASVRLNTMGEIERGTLDDADALAGKRGDELRRRAVPDGDAGREVGQGVRERER